MDRRSFFSHLAVVAAVPAVASATDAASPAMPEHPFGESPTPYDAWCLLWKTPGLYSLHQATRRPASGQVQSAIIVAYYAAVDCDSVVRLCRLAARDAVPFMVPCGDKLEISHEERDGLRDNWVPAGGPAGGDFVNKPEPCKIMAKVVGLTTYYKEPPR